MEKSELRLAADVDTGTIVRVQQTPKEGNYSGSGLRCVWILLLKSVIFCSVSFLSERHEKAERRVGRRARGREEGRRSEERREGKKGREAT